jgi:hypothetical protein
MKIDYIKQQVELIKQSSSDYEAAHSMEDDLYAEFIHHVADGDFGELSEKAREILKTQTFGFARYCA